MEWTRVEKTEEELEEGLVHESLSTSTGSGSSVNRDRRYEGIGLYREAISDLEVDGQGRIWVAQGWTEVPTFEVYDGDGSLLFVATISALENEQGLAYCFDHGMLGFDTQPDDYPKVYMMEVSQAP